MPPQPPAQWVCEQSGPPQPASHSQTPPAPQRPFDEQLFAQLGAPQLGAARRIAESLETVLKKPTLAAVGRLEK